MDEVIEVVRHLMAVHGWGEEAVWGLVSEAIDSDEAMDEEEDEEDGDGGSSG